ncbi:MAG TPA: hypothetical protein VNV88_08170 [Candidatus Solibacter sp.]|jgi:hypothetical protein|nr:hypothetical protein [Candidatus Solibacter sp.]
MKRAHTGPVFFLALCTLVLSGCHKVKPVVLLPQQPPASTHTEAPADQPPTTATPTDTQEQPSTAKPDDQSAAADNQPGKPEKSKPRHHTGPAQKPVPQPSTPNTNGNGKSAPETAKNTPPAKITIVEGGTDSRSGSGQISSGASHNESIHNAASTDQLLESTDTNLHNIKRQLSNDEQSIVGQIHDYMTQSRQATKDGDLVRAHNLALKAHLLSDDLAKQR